MKSIEIIIDTGEELDDEVIFNIFANLISYFTVMKNDDIVWRDTTNRNKNRMT